MDVLLSVSIFVRSCSLYVTCFFTRYEEKRVGRNRMVHYPIGFCTVYQFFAYPDMIRPRISQFFILPPFQRMGLGSKLLQAVYNHILEMPNVLEITGKNYIFGSQTE